MKPRGEASHVREWNWRTLAGFACLAKLMRDEPESRSEGSEYSIYRVP